ncbi:MAG: hypothetical protein AAGI23_10530 [Bacteroidota bacterium]
MKNKYLLFTFALLCFSMTCDNDVSTNCESVDYNIAFQAQSEKSYCISGDIQIRVDSLVNALCPCNARCVQAGEIIAFLSVEEGEKVTQYLVGSENGSEVIDQLSFKIEEYALVETCSGSNPSPEVATVALTVTRE